MAALRASRSGRLVALLAAAALFVATVGTACSGDSDDPAPAASVTGTATTATTTATATATPEPVIVSPAVLNSYRYAIALHLAGDAIDDAVGDQSSAPDLTGASFTIKIDGEVVNPDRERSETRASLGFIELELERIQIGDEAWTREAGGEWKPATAAATSPATGGDLDISPARIFAEGGNALVALNDELRAVDFTMDEVAGLDARRYELDPDQFRAVFGGQPGLLPGDSQPLETRGTLWLAEDSRIPVRIRLVSTDAEGEPAFEMDLTLTDLNAQITIEPPL